MLAIPSSQTSNSMVQQQTSATVSMAAEKQLTLPFNTEVMQVTSSEATQEMHNGIPQPIKEETVDQNGMHEDNTIAAYVTHYT